MTEERLIEILKRVDCDDSYIILLDGNFATIEGNNIWITDEENGSYTYLLSDLRIIRNGGELFDISFRGSCHELEITMKQNINNL